MLTDQRRYEALNPNAAKIAGLRQLTPAVQLRAGNAMLHRRRGDLATIARKAFFKNLELRLVGEAPPPPRIDDRQPAHRCPKTVLMPVHKDKTTDSHHALKAAAVGCLP